MNLKAKSKEFKKTIYWTSLQGERKYGILGSWYIEKNIN